MATDIVIASAARTPIGSFNGAFGAVAAHDLGKAAIKGALLGLLTTLVAAAVPAFEATFTPPRTVLRRSSYEDRARRIVPLAGATGLGMLVLGGALLLVIFYVTTGLLQNHLESTLSKRVFWEYGLLGGGLLAAVVIATFR